MAPDRCPRCGRSCSCRCVSPWWDTVAYSSAGLTARESRGFATDAADEARKLALELAAFLAQFQFRAADKAAAARDEFLRPSRLPLPPPRSPKRNRVCSKAELWRAA